VGRDEDFGRKQLKRIADEDEDSQFEQELGRKKPTRRIIPLDEAKARLLDDLEDNGKLTRRSCEN
jgi:hypothetical protein